MPPAQQPITEPPREEAPAVEYPAMGKNREIMVGPNAWFRVGLQIQAWADFQQQLGGDGGWANNLFVRRGRFLLSGQFMKGVSFFFQTDSPNLGKAPAFPTVNDANPKGFSGLIIQDLVGQVTFAPEFAIWGGLQLIPLARNELQSTTTFLQLDIGNTSAGPFTATTFTSNTRDTGFLLRGLLAEKHFEYRLGIFQGFRAPNVPADPANGVEGEVGSQNMFRLSGYFQYNFFDIEDGYVYAGTNYGKKHIAGVSVGGDFQKRPSASDPYFALSASAYASWGLNGDAKTGGDEIAGLLQFIHYDGQDTFTNLPAQNDLLAEVAYFLKAYKVSVFGKFEMQRFTSEAAKPNNTFWFGGGLKYHLAENNCNFTLAYEFLTRPDAAEGARDSTNHITAALQVFYY